MMIKEIVDRLKNRGLSADEAVEFIHIITKIKTNDNHRLKIDTLPAGLDNFDDSLTIVQRNVLK